MYHDCDTVNKDGTRMLISFKAGQRWILPPNNPFWKRPQDVTNKVKTRTAVNKKRQASNRILKTILKIHKNQTVITTIKIN